MEYKHIVKGRFLERPNRFIAMVEVSGAGEESFPEEKTHQEQIKIQEEKKSQEEEKPEEKKKLQEEYFQEMGVFREKRGSRIETVHVKNTGRCRELLKKGACVYLEKSGNPKRSTAYDLVVVEKGERLINMDSQAPNKAVEEWLRGGGLFRNVTLVQPETRYGNSRFDFYIEAGDEKIFMEVKGVTLEEDGVVRFPDAPSDRAVKHMEELVEAKREGYRALVMFIIQMNAVRYFTPNRETHPQFADALCQAVENGVEVLAYDCQVSPKSMRVNQPVPVVLGPEGGTENKADEVNENFRKKSGKSKLEDIPILLLKWYDHNRRVLPWRELPTPYRVWVSEIMLQQTRVEAVKPYFERFMKELPDIRSLAEAGEETLLKLWEGLGYYNRVRNMQKAAIQIQQEYGGEMPDTYEELLKLAGIGSYTAGAIASIAFGRPVPAVDGNVLRLTARLRADDRPITDVKMRQSVEEELKEIMPAKRPGDFNQAMMEIGACVCIPNGAPQCEKCPLEILCMAHALGKEQNFPGKKPKKPRKIESKTILIVRDENKAAIRKRKEQGLLAGMYEFPSLEGFHTSQKVVEYLADNGLNAIRIQPLEDAKHIFTHREWHMKGYMIRVDELDRGKPKGTIQDWLYIEPEDTKNRYPIPSAFSAYTKYLSIKLGKERNEEEEGS